MYCTNCGAQIAEGSRFCTNCGQQVAAVQDPVPFQNPEETAGVAVETQEQFGQAADQQIPPKKKMKKGLLIGIIAGAAALVAIIVVLLLFVFHIGKVRIDFAKYANVEYSGYDGGGKATVTFDKERFLEDYSGRIKYAKGYENLEVDGFTPAEDLADFYVYCYMESSDSSLKNGDEVICFVQVDPMTSELFNVSIKNEKKVTAASGLAVPFTVEGLQEVELFDPFEGIKISYEGIDPYAELEIDWSGCPEPAGESKYYYTADKSYDLKNGDKVTITLDDAATDYFIAEYGMAPSPTTYTFTVEGLPVLLTSLSQIDAASMSDFETDCNEIIDATYIKNHTEGITTSSYKLVGSILEVDKDPSMYSGNRLHAVYEMTNMVDNSQSYTVNIVFTFEDVGIADGKLSYDVDNYYRERHSIEIPVGSWIITEYYGFATIADVKDYFIDNDSTSYTYETNLP